MPTCPNCGSYIPLGDHSCSCGTTIGYDDDIEEDYSTGRQEYLEWLKEQNPYDHEFFNELLHHEYSKFMIDRMYEGVNDLKEKYGAELSEAEVYNNMAFFNLFVEEKYYDATLRATFHLDNAFDDVTVIQDIITPDFTKTYSSEEVKKIIREMEARTDSRFHYFRMLLVSGVIMVSAVFDDRGYIVDFDNMELVV